VKRPYTSPKTERFSSADQLTQHLQPVVRDLLSEGKELTTVLDKDRRWVSVSEGFANMLGYRVMDLIGRRIDDITVPGSIDIDFVFDAYSRLREMDGVWVFRHRDGRSVVVHYRAHLTETYSYAKLEQLLVA
jgi:PAS domain S-box-containing protein